MGGSQALTDPWRLKPQHAPVHTPSLSLNPSTHGELTTSGTPYFLRKPVHCCSALTVGKVFPMGGAGEANQRLLPAGFIYIRTDKKTGSRATRQDPGTPPAPGGVGIRPQVSQIPSTDLLRPFSDQAQSQPSPLPRQPDGGNSAQVPAGCYQPASALLPWTL